VLYINRRKRVILALAVHDEIHKIMINVDMHVLLHDDPVSDVSVTELDVYYMMTQLKLDVYRCVRRATL
jgi:hypothetical protein